MGGSQASRIQYPPMQVIATVDETAVWMTLLEVGCIWASTDLNVITMLTLVTVCQKAFLNFIVTPMESVN